MFVVYLYTSILVGLIAKFGATLEIGGSYVEYVPEVLKRLLSCSLDRGAETGGRGNMSPPTLKSRGTYYILFYLLCISYELYYPHFYHNIYFDWLVPPPYIQNRFSAPTSRQLITMVICNILRG